MVWDLGKAMRKKEEFESARLMDFEFRKRARAMRLLAAELGLDGEELAQETVLHSDDALLDDLSRRISHSRAELAKAWQAALDQARKDLIGERGDPTPHRLG